MATEQPSNAMPPYFTEADVDRLLTLDEAIEAVEEMFVALQRGEAHTTPRRRERIAGAMLHSMIGSAAYLNRLGWKQYTTTRGGAHFLVGLHDAADGRVLALIEANRLGQLRTGATSAIAARRLHPGPFQRLALFGCGWQAESQLEALLRTVPIGQIAAFSRDRSRREAFCHRMSQRTGRSIDPAADAASAARGADLVVTITTSREPVVAAEALADCRLLVAAGSNAPERIEFPPALCHRAARIVCDDRASCEVEAGELLAAGIDWDDTHELADCFAEDAAPFAEGLTIFKSVGMATADIALAERIIRNRESGVRNR